MPTAPWAPQPSDLSALKHLSIYLLAFLRKNSFLRDAKKARDITDTKLCCEQSFLSKVPIWTPQPDAPGTAPSRGREGG